MFGKWLKSPVIIEMFPKFHFQVCLYSQLSMRTHGSLNLTSCYVNGILLQLHLTQELQAVAAGGRQQSSHECELRITDILASMPSFILPEVHTRTHVQVHAMHQLFRDTYSDHCRGLTLWAMILNFQSLCIKHCRSLRLVTLYHTSSHIYYLLPSEWQRRERGGSDISNSMKLFQQVNEWTGSILSWF